MPNHVEKDLEIRGDPGTLQGMAKPDGFVAGGEASGAKAEETTGHLGGGGQLDPHQPCVSGRWIFTRQMEHLKAKRNAAVKEEPAPAPEVVEQPKMF